jgi:hypothetical protein
MPKGPEKQALKGGRPPKLTHEFCRGGYIISRAAQKGEIE